jgi:hypothetical protein
LRADGMLRGLVLVLVMVLCGGHPTQAETKAPPSEGKPVTSYTRTYLPKSTAEIIHIEQPGKPGCSTNASGGITCRDERGRPVDR